MRIYPRMSDRDPFSRSDLFERALRGILRPLVRALIAQGVTAPAFYRILKGTYVEVAAETLGERATDSGVSVMTGVHRRDVKAFRSEAGPDEGSRRKLSTLATVIGRWMSRTGRDGTASPDPAAPDPTPPDLTRQEFEALVVSVSRDVRPRTVLDELTRQGLVSTSGDVVSLDVGALLGPANMDQRLHFFSENLGDHMSAAVENLLRDQPRFLERAVFYNRLSAASAETLDAAAREVGQAALLDVNRRALALQEADRARNDPTHRIRFGVFFYAEDESDGPDAADEAADDAADPEDRDDP